MPSITMSTNDPADLSPATRRNARMVARITFYLGLMLGMGLGAAAITILVVTPQKFPDPAERWLVGAVFIGLSVMSFGFAAMAKSKVEKLKG